MDQLLQPLKLPIIPHGAVYGTSPLIVGSRALESCRQFSGNSVAHSHASSAPCVKRRCPPTVHVWNTRAQVTLTRWRIFPTLTSSPSSLRQTLLTLFSPHLSMCHIVVSYGPSNISLLYCLYCAYTLWVTAIIITSDTLSAIECLAQ